jgi:uncharacterized metal-binding protein YceD (DUF177 family)
MNAEAASPANPEFSRMVERSKLGEAKRHLTADKPERIALAKRFGIVAVHRMEANLLLEEHGDIITVRGKLYAGIVQSCAISGEDLAVHIDEPIALRFVPAAHHKPDEELELSEDDCDEVEYSGPCFDLGEAIAQDLALAIDPFAVGPDAEQVRLQAGLLGESDPGPFAALAALKKDRD